MFEGLLVLNWRTGEVRVVRKGARRRNPFEIFVRFSIEVELPEPKEHEFRGKIVVPEEQVAEMVFEELRRT